MTLKDRLTVAAFNFGWWSGKHLPESFMRSIFAFVGARFFAKNGDAIKRLKFNLGRVVGLPPESAEVTELARQSVDSYFRYWCEMFRLTHWSKSELARRTRVINASIPAEILAQGRGVVIMATHSGNWDHAGAWAADAFGSLTTVAERLKPESLFDAFVSARVKLNIEILPHRGGDRPAFDVLVERANNAKLVALACDRDLSRGGIEVNFFGATSKMPAGPAKLSLETNCALIPVSISFEGDQTLIEFFPEISSPEKTIESLTQSMATAFEKIVSQHPSNWHMLQQLWLDHPKAWGGRPR